MLRPSRPTKAPARTRRVDEISSHRINSLTRTVSWNFDRVRGFGLCIQDVAFRWHALHGIEDDD